MLATLSRAVHPAMCMAGILMFLSLTACGGGLGSSSDDDDDSITINSIVQSSETVNCKSAAYAVASLSYDGSVNSSNISYSWTQTGGTSVTLVGTTSSTVYFTAPSSAGTVVLKLTVSANSVSASKAVSFTITGSSCTSS